jgi:hypothetical protein
MDTDPDPGSCPFSSVAFKMLTKKKVFFKFFWRITFVGTFISAFKDNKSFRSHKTVEIKVLGSGSVPIITDPNPDPGGPKLMDPDPEH